MSWSSPFYLACSFHKSLIFRFQFQLIPPHHSDSKPNLSFSDVVVNIWHLPGMCICSQWWSWILLTHLFSALIFYCFYSLFGNSCCFLWACKTFKNKSNDTFYNIVLFFTLKTFQVCSQPNCQQNKSPEAF